MKGSLGDRQRLLHILEAINQIESYVEGIDKEEFFKNSMMRFASIKQLEIIGEACNHLSATTKNQSPEVAWTEIVGMRHVFVHEYFGIDSNLLWEIIQSDLVEFKHSVTQLLQNS